MNAMYLVNFFILSIFLALFVLEVGIAILLLTPLKKQRAPWLKYLTPIWEVEGTFGVFYLVNLVATYPGLLPVLDGIYVFPALIAGLFLVARNAFLAYSEYSEGEIERYLKIYSVSTIAVAFIVAAILGSFLSGIGANLSSGTASITFILLDPIGLSLFFAIALMGIGLASIVFDIKEIRVWGLAALAFATVVILGIAAIYIHYTPSALTQVLALEAIPVVLLAILCVLRLEGKKLAVPLAIISIVTSVNLIGILLYPYALGGQIVLTNYLNNAAISGAIGIVTAVFGSLLCIALLYAIYFNYMRKDS